MMEYSEGRLLLELKKGTWPLTHTHVVQQWTEFIWAYKVLAFSYSERHLPFTHKENVFTVTVNIVTWKP